jgi:D-lactate dehydrogenase (cytochrome)
VVSDKGELSQRVREKLAEILGDRFTAARSVREHHGRDESPLPAAAPDAVAFPRSAAEVAEVVRVCDLEGIPVIAFGAGTSLEGHVLATEGGLCLDMSGMDQIIEVRPDDLDVTVQAGVTRKALNERLAREGMFFPVDPGADATLGGMASTGASGTTSVRYGAMRENVLSLEVVLADGRIVQTAHRARKSSAGYDLTRLFVGSEGTLGVITELTLRIYGIPEVVAGAVCHFSDVDGAVRAATTVLQTGIPVARIELLDELAIDAINRYSQMSYPVAPLLMLEFHGSSQEVGEQVRNVGEIVAESGATDYRSAIDPNERTKLWAARHDSFYASLALRPGARAITTDVCVPISRLAECIGETRRDLDERGVTATIVGHVGDGNFHVMMLIDPEDEKERAEAEAINERLVSRALDMDGTCTGEHGVGVRKIHSLEMELPAGVEVMRQIKSSLDPNGIMNPGKVLSSSGPS